MRSFWDGETPFRISKIVDAQKPGHCRICDGYWEAEDPIALIEWPPYDRDDWGMLHPECAEKSPLNILNMKREVQVEAMDYGIQREMVNFIHAATPREVVVKWHPKASRGQRYSFRIL